MYNYFEIMSLFLPFCQVISAFTGDWQSQVASANLRYLLIKNKFRYSELQFFIWSFVDTLLSPEHKDKEEERDESRPFLTRHPFPCLSRSRLHVPDTGVICQILFTHQTGLTFHRGPQPIKKSHFIWEI